jgi:hypothetical protein
LVSRNGPGSNPSQVIGLNRFAVGFVLRVW